MLRKLFAPTLLAFAFAIAALTPTASAQQGTPPIKIGMVKAFFNDLPQVLIDIGAGLFTDVMKVSTGLEGSLSTTDQAFDVAQKLNADQLQLGVFHGHEFAWVQKQYPKLAPMMVAVNKHREVKAYMIVHKNSAARSIADLRGKKLGLPMGTRQHVLAFLEKHSTDNAQPDVKKFYETVERSKSPVNALDEVARGNLDAALVDTNALESYKALKGPVFSKHLRVVQESESFPPPVIVYKQGVLAEATMTRLRNGLLKAHENEEARSLLEMWHIEAFEPIPRNFTQTLADVLKAYPMPEATKVSMR